MEQKSVEVSKEQIEEIAKVVAEVQYLGGLEEKVAERLYNAGYRKQSENTVVIVRCKDCVFCEEDQGAFIYCRLHDTRFERNGFCSYGKMEGGE